MPLKSKRRAVADRRAEDNLFNGWEKVWSQAIVNGPNRYRDIRDVACESMSRAIYESPWMKLVSAVAGTIAPDNDQKLETMRRLDAARWRKNMTSGEFADAMVRIFLTIGFADKVVWRKGYKTISRLFATSPRMGSLEPDEVQQIVREQSRIVQTDADQSTAALPSLLPRTEDRKDAPAMIKKAAETLGRTLEPQKQAFLQRVQLALAA